MEFVTRKSGKDLLITHTLMIIILASILLSYVLDVLIYSDDFGGNNPFVGIQIAVHLLIIILGITISIFNSIKVSIILLLIPVLNLTVPLLIAWVVFPLQFEPFGPLKLLEYHFKSLLFENKWNSYLIRERLLWIACIIFPIVKWIIVAINSNKIVDCDD